MPVSALPKVLGKRDTQIADRKKDVLTNKKRTIKEEIKNDGVR